MDIRIESGKEYQGQQKQLLKVPQQQQENVRLLLNQMGGQVMEDTEEEELLNVFFASVFTAEVGLQES